MNFKRLVKPYQKLLLQCLDYFVSIPSVYDESKETITNDAPYGKPIKDVLHEFAKMGDMYGFDVECDSRYVELSIGNKGPLIEIYGHLDVVPVNKLSTRDLFKLKGTNNLLLGRGVSDDKGPLLAAFMAVKALKDNGLIKNVRVKIFAGGDEERGASCLKYYVKTLKKETPKYGFTPDSKFPVTYGEKGTGTIEIKKNVVFKNVKYISGGEAQNIVIPSATFIVDNIDAVKNRINVPHKINGDAITFIGKAAHGSEPHLGINAFVVGLKTLGTLNNDKSMIDLAELLSDYNGKKANAYSAGKHLGETTYNIGIASYGNGLLNLKINYRFPENVNINELVENYVNAIGAELVNEKHENYLLYDLSSPLIQKLLTAYRAETKDYSEPVTSGGGTYAKIVKNVVAFGPEPSNTDFKNHQDDEFIFTKSLMRLMAVYAHAIYNLISDENKI